MAKRFWLLVLVAALAGGPGYFIYLKYWSGQRIGLYPIESSADRGFRLIPIVLAPDMNPIRVIMHWTYDSLTLTQPLQNGFRATLKRNDQTIATRDFSVSAPSGDKTPATASSVTILDLQVDEPGEYLFSLNERQAPVQELRNIEIEFRRNTHDAHDAPTGAMWGGIALAAVAGVFLARTSKRGKTRT